jgi:nuclear cap-binding protein subunit 1
MVSSTVGKVTNRVRQIVNARIQALKGGLPDEQIAMLEETLVKERDAMRGLFARIDEALNVYAQGSADAFIEGADELQDEALELIKGWANRWQATFRRKAAVEETAVGENAVAAEIANAQSEMVREMAKEEADRQRRAIEEEAKASAEIGANGDANVDLDVAQDEIA